MTQLPYKVCVIVNREFGEKLTQIPSDVPVWIVDTPLNRSATQRLRKERQTDDHLTGITTFTPSDTSSGEDLLLSQMSAIDLHHGPYSSPVPCTILKVIGTPLTDRIEAGLSTFGFNEFTSDPGGFSASRPLPVVE